MGIQTTAPGSKQVNAYTGGTGRTKPARRITLQSLSRSLERHFNFSDPVSLKHWQGIIQSAF